MGIPLAVLIVEDAEDDTLLLVEQLREGGYAPDYARVDTAATMRGALDARHWDLVLADYRMPHFSGPDALRTLQASGQDIPFLVVSANVTEEQAIDMMRAGASDFILKQRLARLLPAIERELREAEIRRARRHAEEALRESEQRLRFIVTHSPDNIFIQNAELRYIWVAQPAYPLTREEYLGRTDFDLVGAADAQHLHEIKAQVLRSGHGTTVEIPLTMKGQRRIFDATYEPWRDSAGQVIGIAGYVRDITDRVEAAAALERERAFLSSAIELLPFPMIFNTPDGEVIRANQASYRFFGDLDPESWWNRQLLSAVTRTPIPREDWPMTRAGKGEVVPPVEGILVLSGRQEVPVLAVAAPVYVGDELVASAVAFTDITPIKEVDRAKNRFLAVLSHELRTPLTNILGWAKEARDYPELVPEALRIIQRNAVDQRRMLENLLEVSRLLHGKLDLQLESVDLWQLATEVAQALAMEAAERRVTIDLAPPDEPLPVMVDRKRIIEVIDNVLKNALRFSPAHGRISMQGLRSDTMAKIVIRDAGRGIAADVLPHIFELFKTSPEVEQTGGGLGLGLPLARALLELHGGCITAESAGQGQGTTVMLAVPLARA